MSREVAREVLRTEAQAILALVDRLDDGFDRAIELLFANRGRVVVSGMGKSGIIGKKIAATLTSTGTPAYFLHPAEAVHGDVGMLVDGDVVVLLSNSGETSELLRLIEVVKRMSLRSIALVGRKESTLGRWADVVLDCGIAREACPLGLAPTASTTAALALGDALALALAARRGFTAEDFARRHPGGRLGKELLRVVDVMHSGGAVPRVGLEASLATAVAEMSRGGFGMTVVEDTSGLLAGIFTDGDLRRLLAQGASIDGRRVGEFRTPEPKVVHAGDAAARALAVLEQHKITSVIVVDDVRRVQGVVHLHDLWRLEMF